jgi:hypothetical protein
MHKYVINMYFPLCRKFIALKLYWRGLRHSSSSFIK